MRRCHRRCICTLLTLRRMTLPAFAAASRWHGLAMGHAFAEMLGWCGANHLPCEPASSSLLLYAVRTYIRDVDYAGFLLMRCFHSSRAIAVCPGQQDYFSVPNPETKPGPPKMEDTGNWSVCGRPNYDGVCSQRLFRLSKQNRFCSCCENPNNNFQNKWF